MTLFLRQNVTLFIETSSEKTTLHQSTGVSIKSAALVKVKSSPVLFKKWIEGKCILSGYEQHLVCAKRVKSHVKSEGLYASFAPTKCCSYPDNMHLPSIHNLYLYQIIQNAVPKIVNR